MEQELMNTIERWEITGLLEGLPMVDKSELSMIYDNLTRILLGLKLDEGTEDILGTLCLLCARKVYRTRGVFDQEVMMDRLKDFVRDKNLTPDITDELGVVSDLCLEFVSTYEDDETKKGRLNNEQYKIKVTNLLSKVEDILLDRQMVSFVDDDWESNYPETESTKSDSRIWNQNQATEFMKSVLNEMNKG